MVAPRSITELPNQLTHDIDVATPLQIVRLLRAADYQIFGGYGGYAGLYDSEMIRKVAGLAAKAAEVLRSRTGCIVLSGAGTSGRLAMFTARAFNQKLGTDLATGPFRYTIAGGDAALIQSQEGAEDDPHQGIADLERAAAGADDVLFIGITCGLSAPYIAGQLEHILSGKMNGHPVLLGFNPVDLSRNTPIEGWPSSFMDTARRMEAAERDGGSATVLNPVVGPEPITGSTRMKSGSATKILLEVIFEAASAVEEGADPADPELAEALKYITTVLFREYEGAIRDAYLATDKIAQLVEAGGKALKSAGHIYYLGATGGELISNCGSDCDHDEDEHDHSHDMILRSEGGILGLVDASECPPTYGADFEDVRGFLHEGWSALLPGSGTNLSEQGSPFRVGLDDFRELKLPTLTSKDLVVTLGAFPDRDALLTAATEKGAQTAALSVAGAGNDPTADIVIEIQPNLTSVVTEENEHGAPEVLSGPVQLSYKLVLNALTTGAHVLAGKVYGNRMVDLRISNNKLFHRTVGIISDLMGVDQNTATEALIKSTYETDALTVKQSGGQIRDHIEVAKGVDKVVPKALLIATGKFTYAQAAAALKENPVVRTAIGTYVIK